MKWGQISTVQSMEEKFPTVLSILIQLLFPASTLTRRIRTVSCLLTLGGYVLQPITTPAIIAPDGTLELAVR